VGFRLGVQSSSTFKGKTRYCEWLECILPLQSRKRVDSKLTHSFFSMVHACFSDVDVIFVVNSGDGPVLSDFQAFLVTYC